MSLPRFRLDHLDRLSDRTGILQHARFTVPAREHGYCTDDNARALLVLGLAAPWVSAGELATRTDGPLAFVAHALAGGRFKNFMSYGRQWLEETGSEDCHGRAMWGLGHTATLAPTAGQRALARELLDRAVPAALGLGYPRSIAYAVLGLVRLPELHRGAIASLASRLVFAPDADWPWPEPVLTYDNAVLCAALIRAGACLEDRAMIRLGLDSLRWLCEVQRAPAGHLSPVGNAGWYPRGGTRAPWGQQPLEAAGLVHACLAAHEVSGEPAWRQQARTAFAWFTGENDQGLALCDEESGGCCDGLESWGKNPNQGAESTLAWLAAQLWMRRLQ